ncbi:hypothetical protein GCM10023185_14720 [Hymenobacter saemangeumensis]|uniref:AAA+ ATPase domain-containing protein n=1 Tax=Hymenobacter saemangeumensis TaxID=1084522 RepID=A0ABP8I8T7_9BACT
MPKVKVAPEKRAVKRSVSMHDVLNNKYKMLDLDPEWRKYIGHPQENFKMIVYGESGGGKTTFVMRLCVALTKLGKVYYNSAEEGEGATIQAAAQRCNVKELCAKGSFMLGDRDSFDDMVYKLSQKRSAPFVVLDSLQYMELKEAQFKQLVELFKRKVFIVISWSKGASPNGKVARAVEYMADIKTYVSNGKAVSRSRFGPTEPYEIYPPRQVEVKKKGRPAKAKAAPEPELFSEDGEAEEE